MLPPGHVAAGFLVAKGLLNITKPPLDPYQINNLMWWGVFFGFAPDLDTFIAFALEKSFTVNKQQNNHRKFFSHAPIIWLIIGLMIFFLAHSTYIKCIGLLVWLGSWSHFLLDSIDYGIMWLWPFNKKVYALRNREIVFPLPRESFFLYWITFIKYYVKSKTFYTELAILVVSVLILIK